MGNDGTGGDLGAFSVGLSATGHHLFDSGIHPYPPAMAAARSKQLAGAEKKTPSKSMIHEMLAIQHINIKAVLRLNGFWVITPVGQ